MRRNVYILKTRLLVILILAISFSGSRSKQTEPFPKHGLLWKITGNGLKSTSYLFGTYHDRGGMQILDSIKIIDSIFNSSSQLICEYQLSDLAERIQQQMRTKSKKPDNGLKPWPIADSTYENLLTAAQKNILDSALNANELLKKYKKANLNLRPVNLLNLIKFSFNDSTRKTELEISGESVQKNDTLKESILDLYFQKLAKRKGMKIVSLDSEEKYQEIKDSVNSRFSLLSYKTEVEILIYYIENQFKIETLKQDMINSLLSAYLKQDISFSLNQNKPQQEELYLISNKFSSFFGNDNIKEIIYKNIFDERNDFWIKKIPGLLKEGSCFIAVGAGHLSGTKGLINQLRELDFSVVPIIEN